MKKMMKLAFVAVIAAVAGYNVYKSQSVMNGMSEFALANVEALAQNEVEDTCGGCASYFLGKECCIYVFNGKAFVLYYEK